MIFGRVPLARAEGAVLAHSLAVAGGRLRKGQRLGAAELAALAAEGHAEVTVARPGPGDLPEDEAARRLGAALAADPAAAGVEVGPAATGRVNLSALHAGVLRVDAARVNAVNALDEAITLATLPDFARVAPRQLVATVKIIPWAAPAAAVARAEALLAGPPAVRVHGVRLRTASLALTRTPGMKPALLDKGAEALRVRLAALGMTVADEARVAHETGALAEALRAARGEMVLVLGASAPSDRGDVGPAAVTAAGGRVERFGMPVDPGNLMFLGRLTDGRPVLGMPGSARSPALSGTDWVLERLACGLAVGAADIAGMGVGGLLKEIPSRPQPRAGGTEAPARPRVSGLLLAAGSARRMRGADKLLEPVEGAPVLRRAAEALLEGGAAEVVAVLRPGDAARAAALAGLPVRIVENAEAAEGMAASIRAGLRGAAPEADAVILALGDMPEVGAEHVRRLIAAYAPEAGRAIVRAVDEDGRPGHPVLFGRRFFESLARLTGDEGAREVLRAHAEFAAEAPTPGRGARLDLDTPEAWAAWRAGRSGKPQDPPA